MLTFNINRCVIYIKIEYQKIANLLDNASNQSSRFRTRNLVEVNDDSPRTYTNADIKFKTTMLKSDLCDYADAYIFVIGTITMDMEMMMLQDN